MNTYELVKVVISTMNTCDLVKVLLKSKKLRRLRKFSYLSQNCPQNEVWFDYMSHLIRLWYLSHGRPAKTQASLRIWSMEVDEGCDQKSDIKPHWMAAHVRLKNEFKEDEKCGNLMSWLI